MVQDLLLTTGKHTIVTSLVDLCSRNHNVQSIGYVHCSHLDTIRVECYQQADLANWSLGLLLILCPLLEWQDRDKTEEHRERNEGRESNKE